MTEKSPLVTINILSFNRKEDLKNTLKKVYDQNYKNIEVIVVDNASTDGTAKMIESEFPLVKIISLKKNIGIEAWNEGFKFANGKYVLVLDDDAYPEKNAIELAVNKLENNEQAACIAFNIFDLNSKTYFWSSSWLPSQEIENDIFWPVFVGCSVMFSKKKINLIELMPKNYFLYQHELPVSAEINIKGFKILFNKEILAYHKCKPETIYNEKNDKLVFRNNLLFLKRFIPLILYPFYKLQLCAFYLTRSIKRKWFEDYKNIIKETKKVERNKITISFSYLLELRRLHLFNFSNFSKLKYLFKD